MSWLKSPQLTDDIKRDKVRVNIYVASTMYQPHRMYTYIF